MKEVRIFVLCFSKLKYNRERLEKKTDCEKYLLATIDAKDCFIFNSDEYTMALNEAKPMDTCVYTYIVSIPSTNVLATSIG